MSLAIGVLAASLPQTFLEMNPHSIKIQPSN
jgi:hypothetical protein